VRVQQHVEHENGVQHEVQAVVILMHDVMERVQVLRVQQHVQEELNIVEQEQVVVVQYQHDITRHDVMVHEINVHDRLSVVVEVIVQMESAMHVEHENIVVQERPAVVQQVYDIMLTHHVVRLHVQINQVIQAIQVTEVVIAVVGHVIQTIIKNEVVVYIIGKM
jgi:hypothetical protein